MQELPLRLEMNPFVENASIYFLALNRDEESFSTGEI